MLLEVDGVYYTDGIEGIRYTGVILNRVLKALENINWMRDDQDIIDTEEYIILYVGDQI